MIGRLRKRRTVSNAFLVVFLGVATVVALMSVVNPAEAAAGGGRSSGVAAGDFNGDHRDDLAVGVPGENSALLTNAGAVHVFYGRQNGLSAQGDQLWHQDVDGVRGVANSVDGFGSVVAAGDLNGDGFDDLAIGTPYDEDPMSGEIAGTVNVLYGSNNGLTASHDDFWYQDSPDIRGSTDDGDRFGASLAIGRFGRGKIDDLVVGAPGDIITVGTTPFAGAGAVHLLFGSQQGVKTDGNQFWHQGSEGVRGTPETNDHFGESVTAADFGKSETYDLAVGTPGEDGDAGQVQVLYGGPDGGLTATGDDLVLQGVDGVPGAQAAEEQTGWTVAAGQLGNGQRKDLAIAAPFENSGSFEYSGIVLILYGSGSGISSEGSQKWSRARLGAPVDNDTFGSDLVIADLTGDKSNDLAVGSEFATVGAVFDAGAVHVIRGSEDGLLVSGDRLWHQNSPGIANNSEAYDSFGLSIAAGDFDGTGDTDLAVGAPSEDFGSEFGHGALHVLYGKSMGLSADGDQFWTQDSPGVRDEREAEDQFSSYFRSLD